MKRITIRFDSLCETRAHEYLTRFIFGGLCTVFAGWIAKRFGPGIGGLFLAFPAIFPASATMIESHEKRKKAEINADGTMRGRVAASIDAAGAVLGCLGLMLFGLIIWKTLPKHEPLTVIPLAFIGWAGLSYLLWTSRRA